MRLYSYYFVLGNTITEGYEIMLVWIVRCGMITRKLVTGEG
jgi:hypothetical protein